MAHFHSFLVPVASHPSSSVDCARCDSFADIVDPLCQVCFQFSYINKFVTSSHTMPRNTVCFGGKRGCIGDEENKDVFSRHVKISEYVCLVPDPLSHTLQCCISNIVSEYLHQQQGIKSIFVLHCSCIGYFQFPC